MRCICWVAPEIFSWKTASQKKVKPSENSIRITFRAKSWVWPGLRPFNTGQGKARFRRFNKSLAIIILFATIFTARSADLNLIPWPAKVDQWAGQFILNSQTAVETGSAFTNEAALLASELQLTNRGHAHSDRILLTARGAAGLPAEGYKLEVDREGVIIRAASSAGAFYGCQTLRQLIEPRTQSIPFVKIVDAPRFAWRGLMLDVSRHFFDQRTIFHVLDWMADYKLNRLHLHLTDNEAWRLENKQYPELTRIGARGNHSNSNAPPRFFTQKQMRAIIAYAQQRHIVVVPEIDMPGHAGAAIRAYPRLDGGANTFDPANEATYKFLGNVLDEVIALFPSPWIHLGGDEVDQVAWRRDTDVPRFLKQKHLKDTSDLEGYFDRRMESFILRHGRIPLGWDEIMNYRPVPGTIVYWWRHNKPQVLMQALTKGYFVVLTPRSPCYFDYPQDKSYPPIGWGLYNTLEAVYQGPKVLTDLTPIQRKHILGLEACVWTEHIATVPYLEFKLFPRLAAMAEAAWTPVREQNFAEFKTRLMPFLQHYRQCGISYYNANNPVGSLRAATQSGLSQNATHTKLRR